MKNLAIAALCAFVVLTSAPVLANECEWTFIENLDPDDCNWNQTTSTLTCPGGWTYTCSGGGPVTGGGSTGAGPTIGSGPDLAGGSGSSGPPANGTEPLSGFMEFMIDSAKEEALEKLEQPTCSIMWTLFGLTPGPQQTLAMTDYRDGRPTAPCLWQNPPFAWMQGVGTFVVNICPILQGFSSRAPYTVLHEAMHSGGMPEAPTPGALQSYQITELIETNCPC